MFKQYMINFMEQKQKVFHIRPKYIHIRAILLETLHQDIVKNRLLHGIHKRIIQELQLQLYNLRTGIYINEKFKIYFYSVNNIKCYSNYFR